MNKCYRFFCASWFVFSYIFLCCSYLFSQFLYNNNLYSGCPFESSLLLYYASIRYIFLFFSSGGSLTANSRPNADSNPHECCYNQPMAQNPDHRGNLSLMSEKRKSKNLKNIRIKGNTGTKFKPQRGDVFGTIMRGVQVTCPFIDSKCQECLWTEQTQKRQGGVRN